MHSAYEIFSIDFPFSMIMKMENQWKKFAMIMIITLYHYGMQFSTWKNKKNFLKNQRHLAINLWSTYGKNATAI